MFSDRDVTSLSFAAVSALLVACSMLAVQQHKRLCRQFVDMSAAPSSENEASHSDNFDEHSKRIYLVTDSYSAE